MVTRVMIVILVFLTSCASIPKSIYQDSGLSFKIAEDFRIGKSNTYKKNQATYIPIQLRDKGLYGKFSIVWFPGKGNLEYEIWNYSDMLKQVYEKEDPANKPEFGPVKDTMFGSHADRDISIKAKVWEREREWRIWRKQPMYYKYEPHEVKELYFGINCDAATQAVVFEIMNYVPDDFLFTTMGFADNPIRLTF